MALVGYAGRLKTSQRHHAAQEEKFTSLNLANSCSGRSSGGSQRGYVHHLSPHGVQQFIKTFGGKTLKESIGIALAAHHFTSQPSISITMPSMALMSWPSQSMEIVMSQRSFASPSGLPALRSGAGYGSGRYRHSVIALAASSLMISQVRSRIMFTKKQLPAVGLIFLPLPGR